MSYGRITTETMTDIADAIRAKTGSEAQLTPAEMPAAIANIQTEIPRFQMTSSDTVVAIEPNCLFVWPEMEELTINLTPIENNNIVNEYHFIFVSGATATVTDFPAIPGLDDFAAEANMAYEVSILEGRALVTSWEVSNA